MRRASLTGAVVALAGALSGPVAAQDLGVPLSPVLVIDTERIYSTSLPGERVTQELENRFAELAAENRRIEAELEAEELELTAKRAEMPAAEFSVLANAFDEKVQKIRAEQDAKRLELQRLRDRERQGFIEQIAPILSRIANDRGAYLILDRRNVLLTAETIDITDEAIARINAVLGATSPDTGDTDTGDPPQPANDNGPGAAPDDQ